MWLFLFIFQVTINPKYPSANRCLRLYSACLYRMSLFLFNVIQKIWCKLFKNLLLSFSQIWLEVCSQIWSEFFTNLIGGFSKKFELVRTTSSGGSTLPYSLFLYQSIYFFKCIWHFILMLLIYRINALFLINQSCFLAFFHRARDWTMGLGYILLTFLRATQIFAFFCNYLEQFSSPSFSRVLRNRMVWDFRLAWVQTSNWFQTSHCPNPNWKTMLIL